MRMLQACVIIHNIIIFMNVDNKFEAEMENYRDLDVVGAFYGSGPRPPDNFPSAQSGGGGHDEKYTLHNGIDEDLFTSLDLWKKKIK